MSLIFYQTINKLKLFFVLPLNLELKYNHNLDLLFWNGQYKEKGEIAAVDGYGYFQSNIVNTNFL